MPMGISLLEKTDISPLDKLLVGNNGLLRPIPYAELKAFPHGMIQQWCVQRGVYQVPTQELIDFLATHANKRTIEICAGNGVLGRSLNLIMTDSYSLL